LTETVRFHVKQRQEHDMKTETTPVPVDTPLGTLYVAIRRAREDSYHETGRGRVTVLRPRLFVSTAPEFEARPDASEHWVIRGRKYGVQKVFYTRDTPNNVWHHDNRDWSGDGYRDDRNGEVNFRTATHNAIDGAVTAGLDVFATLHPQWAQVSEYLEHHAEAESAASKALTLRHEANKHEARGELAEAEALTVIAGAPAELRSLIIP
jgi:hypothetical protein